MSILGFFLFGIPVFFGIVIKLGYTGREHVVGIDLGTTYSVIGVKRNGSVVIISDAHGKQLIPSVVSFQNRGKIVVGHEAKEYAVKDPTHTIFNAKRFIGRKWDPIMVEEAINYDYKVQEDSNSKDPAFSCFRLDVPGHTSCVSPIQVGSYVVNHLKEMAKSYLGHDQITTVVIAVPADFDATQRKHTKEAFERAGLTVARILDEPVAAAAAYGLNVQPDINYVLVFDFGGGTLDVSLLYIVDKNVQIIGKGGDNQLGGEDLDARIYHYLKDTFEAQMGESVAVTDIIPSSNEHPGSGHFPCTTAGIRRSAESIKRRLSDATEADATCIVHHKTSTHAANSVLTIPITRLKVEELCQSLLDRTMIVVHRVLEESSMAPSEVDAVVLVGGSSRIPWIHRALKHIFGREPLSDIDPDLAVAYGAANIVD